MDTNPYITLTIPIISHPTIACKAVPKEKNNIRQQQQKYHMLLLLLLPYVTYPIKFHKLSLERAECMHLMKIEKLFSKNPRFEYNKSN